MSNFMSIECKGTIIKADMQENGNIICFTLLYL